jgi:dipeptidyl aminopeptidase/acylaminoacyl peptidase
LGGTNLHWAADGRIVFASYLGGQTQLYSVDENGGEPLLLTPGNYLAEFIRLSPDRRFLIVSGNAGDKPEDIDRRHLILVPVGRADPKILTSGEGLEWDPVFTGDGKTIAFVSATPQRPPLPAVISIDGKNKRLLAEDRIPKDFPADKLVTPKQVVLNAPDGVKVHCQLFESAAFKGKKPAVIYVHGGPPRQMLLGWHYSDYYSNMYALNQYLASKGYVVLSVNYRLGIGYGFEFHNPLNAGWRGASEYQDVKAAGDYLQKLPQVDPRRIGIYGGSYGGFLTAMALARDSNIFAVGVDLHGVHDWTATRSSANWLISSSRNSYETPPDLARAIEMAWRSSPVSSVSTWRSPVLLIHGDDDRNVKFSQTVDLVARLEKAGVPYEELVLPDEVHSFLRYASWQKATTATVNFLDKYLKPNVRQ